MLTNHLFHTVHPASYCACCGFPWKGKWMSPGRAGTSTAAESSCSGCKAGSTGSSAPGFWQGAIQPNSIGAEFKGPGVRGHHTGGEKRTLRKEPPVTSLPAAGKHRLWPQLPAWTESCHGRDWVQAWLAVGCLWNGANRNWNFPPTLFFSCFFFSSLLWSSLLDFFHGACLVSTVKRVVLLFEVCTSLFSDLHVVPLREDQTL